MKKLLLVLFTMALTSIFAHTASAADLPSWVENGKVSGDIRVRYQDEDTSGDDDPHRNRDRVRLRVGFDTKVNDYWKAGFGLATGGSDPRSTNETLDKTFETPDIRLDYAYALFSPVEWASLQAGKIKNPLWLPKDLLWDGDIRPDGFAAKLGWKVSPNLNLFVIPAYFILDEFKSTVEDPYLMLIQARVELKMEVLYAKLAATYYDFTYLEGNSFANGAGSNSLDEDENLLYDYDSFAAGLEIGAVIAKSINIAFFGEYVQSNADEDSTGYLAGIKVGSKNMKKLGDWKVSYLYRYLERDAWPDFLPDSDFAGGMTNARGSELELSLALAKNVTLGFDYYITEPIDYDQDEDKPKETIMQVDLELKW